MPEPLTKHFFCVKLSDLLLSGIPNMHVEELTTENRKANLAKYIEKLRDLLPTLPATTELAIFDIDRAHNKAWSSQISFDVVPSLRTKGPEYFIVSVRDLDKPLSERRFFRLLAEGERFLLQGHPSDHSELCGKTFLRFLAGNAFAVPMVASVVGPLLLQLAKSHEVLQLANSNDVPKPKRARVE